MSKLTPQIAAMYLGCKLTAQGEVGTMTGIELDARPDHTFITYIPDGGYDSRHCRLFDVKALHLKKLEDMTEEEGEEVWHMDEPQAILEMNTKTLRRKVVLCPERNAYLLSKSFDLFGLIDSKDAIDAKTLDSKDTQGK